MTALAFTQGFENAAPGVIGHCTQVVWAVTPEMGCGFKVTDTRRNVRISIIKYFIYTNNLLFL